MTHHEHDKYRAENRMKTARRNLVSAVFHDADDAEDAYARTIERGYSRDDVMVLMSDQARDEYFPSERVEVERESKAMEGAGVGGALGTALGAIAGAIAAVGTAVAIPGLGLIVAGIRAGLRLWGSGRVQGVATREEAERLLGRSRLCRHAAIVRPDLYGKDRGRA